MTKRRDISSLVFWATLVLVAVAGSFDSAAAQDRNPVIIIPGITGSELINGKTGEVVWYRAPRPNGDGLRLPVSADITKVRDSLVPGDILRSVKIGILPRIDIYGGLIEALASKAGYHEEVWEKTSRKSVKNAIFVFPYDWRLDNVENARLLVRKITRLKKRLKLPKLKFDVIAHSMGGIIVRYAAMYGDMDLPAGDRRHRLTWAGAEHFDRIVLLGTPNEGSALALNSMLNGASITGINIKLPWIQNLSKFDLFTIPAAYELMPAPGTFRVVDENLEPINIDLYDPVEWTKYGWNAIDDKGFRKRFKPMERNAAPAFFIKMLGRSKRLHEALAAGGGSPSPVSINIIGAECKDSLDTIVLIRERRSGKWKTIFKPGSFLNNRGVDVTADELKTIMFGPGDGVVTVRSLEGDNQARNSGGGSELRPASTKFFCEEHDRLPANGDVQDYIISLLGGLTQPAVVANPKP